MKLISIILFLAVFVTKPVIAGSWSESAVPTRIDIERGNGVMVYGAFGNADNCSIGGRFYLKKEHPQYDKAYSAILAAFSAGKKVQVYVNRCEPVTWYATTDTTFNVVSAAGAVYIMN